MVKFGWCSYLVVVSIVTTNLHLWNRVAPTFFRLAALSFTLYKAFVFRREHGTFRSFGLVYVIVRDESIYSYLYAKTFRPLGENWWTFISMILIFIVQMCGSLVQVSNLGPAIFKSLMDHPSFLSVVGCRMLFHMKEMGASGMQQVEDQTSGGPKSTLAPIEFADITQQSGSSAGRTPRSRTGVESDTSAWAGLMRSETNCIFQCFRVMVNEFWMVCGPWVHSSRPA